MVKNRFNAFDFDRAFRSWERQAGFPVIHVHFNATSSQFEITQQRYFEQKELNKNDFSSYYIPINFATSVNPNFEDTRITNYFLNNEAELKIASSASQWYVFNKQQLGYYRVNYDAANWLALSDALNGKEMTKIHVMNRAQLIDDAFQLTHAGYLDDYQTAFDIVKYLINEDDYFPFYSANRHLDMLYTVFGKKNEILNVSLNFLNHFHAINNF
jgi:aminopeptidase N